MKTGPATRVSWTHVTHSLKSNHVQPLDSLILLRETLLKTEAYALVECSVVHCVTTGFCLWKTDCLWENCGHLLCRATSRHDKHSLSAFSSRTALSTSSRTERQFIAVQCGLCLFVFVMWSLWTTWEREPSTDSDRALGRTYTFLIHCALPFPLIQFLCTPNSPFAV